MVCAEDRLLHNLFHCSAIVDHTVIISHVNIFRFYCTEDEALEWRESEADGAPLGRIAFNDIVRVARNEKRNADDKDGLQW